MPAEEQIQDQKDARAPSKAPMSEQPGNIESDPFERLHKMSTTAGLGSGDYVAINGSAIAAVLLGVGSAMVLFNSPVLLVVPLAGVIAAILAFRQVAMSNGTQTGREVAAVGLLLSLGFGGYHIYKTASAGYHNEADEKQIIGMIHQLGDDIRNSKIAPAYSMFDDHIKSHVNPSVFEGTLSHLTTRPILGDLQGMDWNELLVFESDPVNSDRIATGMVKLKYANSAEPLRISMSFRKIDGNWMIEQMPQVFPDETPAAAGPQGPGQGPQKPSALPTYGPLGPAKPAN